MERLDSFERHEATEFLSPLIQRSRGDGGLRDLRGLGRGRVLSLFTANLVRALDFCRACVDRRCDAYASTLSRRVPSSRAAAVAGYDALWADLDCGRDLHVTQGHDTVADALDVVASFPLAPTLLVDSGHGVHAWWLLESPLEHPEWRSLIERLNRTLRGDWAALDPARILRVPGTINFKGEPVRVRLIDVGSTSRVESMRVALDEMSPPSPPAQMSLAGPEVGDLQSVVHCARKRSTGTPFDEANDIPVVRVLERLGVTSLHMRGLRTYCGCPICPGPDNEEMLVGGRSNVATCFGDCRKAFTNVDLACAVLGISPRAAVDWLAETFGLVGFPRAGVR